ncbi:MULTISPECIES: glycoside hydrolase family 10 protein [Streptomycetaceae]|nr:MULTISPECIES: family 10 glycosylhydrolase [Streptomycetaceae]MYS62010.1 family 10 glycosylhydrolase [Streptomyces sp. SID5468]CCB77903.1 putative secreted protein [Streptantibioticus cattleyicolor NRRL 8057 = DSM 46488]
MHDTGTARTRPIDRRRFATAAAATLLAAAGPAPEASAARHRRWPEQFRGMWVATVANIDWPSAPGLPAHRQRAELDTLLDTALTRRLNAVILQVRPAADAFWPSRYEPWSRYLTGTQGRDPGWDPLGYAVRAAHDRGLELHAWFNPYRVANTADAGALVPWHPARRHPDWVVAYGGGLYYNPGLPEVRRFVEDAMLDAVARYPLDAVHWDDYFYPYPVAGRPFDDDAAYAAYGGDFPDRASWRRHNTDLLVRETAERIRRTRPGTRFGISPFGVWRNRSSDPLGSATTAGVQSYDDLYADTRTWVRQGWIDYICPQLYWSIGPGAADYAVLVPWWARTVEGTRTHLYIGEALYKQGGSGAWSDPAELTRHLDLDARYPQVRGNAYFSAKDVAADPTGALRRVVRDHYPTRARVPR